MPVTLHILNAKPDAAAVLVDENYDQVRRALIARKGSLVPLRADLLDGQALLEPVGAAAGTTPSVKTGKALRCWPHGKANARPM